MNIFLLHPDPKISAHMFLARDPVRARKQLLECCQIIATLDIVKTGTTCMLKADGNPYKKTHEHHPCVTHCFVSSPQYFKLLLPVTQGLSDVFPDHACSNSFIAWAKSGANQWRVDNKTSSYVVVRRDHDHAYVDSIDSYARMMNAYLQNKWSNDVL